MENETYYNVDSKKLDEILSDRDICSGAKLVLLKLIYRLRGKNYAFPSQKTLAKDVGLSERQVRNHLELWKQRRIIKLIEGINNPKTGLPLNSNCYDLSEILWRKKE